MALLLAAGLAVVDTVRSLINCEISVLNGVGSRSAVGLYDAGCLVKARGGCKAVTARVGGRIETAAAAAAVVEAAAASRLTLNSR